MGCCGPYGKHYNEKLDKPRLRKQLDVVRAQMLVADGQGRWLTLVEIEEMTGYPQASISADLRHLRKPRRGGYLVEKRRRGNKASGLWEYRVTVKKEAAV